MELLLLAHIERNLYFKGGQSVFKLRYPLRDLGEDNIQHPLGSRERFQGTPSALGTKVYTYLVILI